MFGHRPPLWEPGAFRRRLKALSLIRGSPTKLVFPIGVHHVQGMLRLHWSQLGAAAQRRAGCMRNRHMCAPMQIPSVQACNV